VAVEAAVAVEAEVVAGVAEEEAAAVVVVASYPV
jgi:hypothetical protein